MPGELGFGVRDRRSRLFWVLARVCGVGRAPQRVAANGGILVAKSQLGPWGPSPWLHRRGVRGGVSERDGVGDFARRNEAPPGASPLKVTSSHVELIATANYVPRGV